MPRFWRSSVAEAEAGPIEIRLASVRQLFHTLDPTPFREGDLAAEAEDYILAWARDLPREAPIRIVVHLPAEAEAPDPAGGHPQFFRRPGGGRDARAGRSVSRRVARAADRAGGVVGLPVPGLADRPAGVRAGCCRRWRAKA